MGLEGLFSLFLSFIPAGFLLGTVSMLAGIVVWVIIHIYYKI